MTGWQGLLSSARCFRTRNNQRISAKSVKISVLFSLFSHQIRRLINLVGKIFECFSNDFDLILGFEPFSLLKCFTNCRQSFDTVAGIKTGRVNLMFKPITARQSGIVKQSAFGLIKNDIIAACGRSISPTRRRWRPPTFVCIHPTRGGASQPS